MRAWQVIGTGNPADVVNLVEIDEPQISEKQSLIKMEAASVGFPDYLLARGQYHDKPAVPFLIGGEGVGRVVRVGLQTSGFDVGDRVIVVAGRSHSGHLAEFVVADPDQLLPVSESMPAEHAAALFVAYQTSYVGLYRRAALTAGETLVVHGASGGIGSAAIQLGKARSATVIAVAGGERKAEACRQLGADYVIDHHNEDFVARVKDITDGRGADVIYDSVGGDVFDRSRRCIAAEGRLLVVGFAGGQLPLAPVNHALLKNYSIVGFRMRPFRDDLNYRAKVHGDLLAMYERGVIAPLTTRYRFEDVPVALDAIGFRRVIGRNVIDIADARLN